MTILHAFSRRRRIFAVTAVAAVALAACSSGSKPAASTSSTTAASSSTTAAATGLDQPGVLTVGVDLQFKPQEYLTAQGQPAGYDVDILNKLAQSLGVKLKLQNLDFNGLIPGLQSRTFDLVSLGLQETPARDQVISFSRPYIPYALILAVAANDKRTPTVATYNQKGFVITALQGSTDAQLAASTFPKATVLGLTTDNAALLDVATGRAQGAVVETSLVSQYQASNPGQVKKAALPALNVTYGQWAVQRGNTTLINKLNTFLCSQLSNGTLASTWTTDYGVATFPGLPNNGC
jgi:ABC-type amino acid transport substrate-binding protein